MRSFPIKLIFRTLSKKWFHVAEHADGILKRVRNTLIRESAVWRNCIFS